MSEPANEPKHPSEVKQLDALRNKFMQDGLHEHQLAADPFRQFTDWYNLVLSLPIHLPDAMTLATASADGKPAARMVLLKSFDERGFAFFTNYESRKAQELTANPHAALVLFWKELNRQVRIEGDVEKTTEAESDAYFVTRPWGSRVSASISRQSMVIDGRGDLERQFVETNAAHPDEQLQRPAFWGGFRVVPTCVEFWQGRLNRLHDRLRYTRSEHGRWRVERLSP